MAGRELALSSLGQLDIPHFRIVLHPVFHDRPPSSLTVSLRARTVRRKAVGGSSEASKRFLPVQVVDALGHDPADSLCSASAVDEDGPSDGHDRFGAELASA